jgi:twitching motility protein PilT
MLKLEDLLRIVVKERGSDLIIKAGGFPAIRVGGTIRFVSDQRLAPEVLRGYQKQILADEEGMAVFQRDGAVDRAVDIPDVGRFRCNVFSQHGEVGLVARYIHKDIPGFKDLNLPVDQLKKLSSLQRGLVLATGIAGSGKSTTLAAMVEYINRSFHKHIITVEDPIEFLFEDKRSVVNQREIGTDAPSFSLAMRHAVRQSPDVIMIGEMRDRETVEAAIAAAETGHLVLSTLHTVNAVQTVERIITFFPPHQHDLIRLQLALNLAGVMSMRLIRINQGQGLVPATEILINTPTIREALEEGRTKDLPKYLAEGAYYGTMTFNQSLLKLYESGNISYEEVLAASDSPDELKLLMRGITKGMVTRGAHQTP